MDQILNKPNTSNIKYELNATNSDSDGGYDDDDSRELALAIEENIVKQESSYNPSETGSLHTSLTKDIMDTDIILPQAAQNSKLADRRKEMKTRRELEEEEREKMQYVISLLIFKHLKLCYIIDLLISRANYNEAINN